MNSLFCTQLGFLVCALVLLSVVWLLVCALDCFFFPPFSVKKPTFDCPFLCVQGDFWFFSVCSGLSLFFLNLLLIVYFSGLTFSACSGLSFFFLFPFSVKKPTIDCPFQRVLQGDFWFFNVCLAYRFFFPPGGIFGFLFDLLIFLYFSVCMVYGYVVPDYCCVVIKMFWWYKELLQ